MGQILVIDDEWSIREIVSMLLADLGYEVKMAENGEEGIALFRKFPDIDLVITDIRMPGINGNEVAQHIRNSSKSNTPLVAMTTFPDDIQKGVFNFTLTKPFMMEDLQGIIELLGQK